MARKRKAEDSQHEEVGEPSQAPNEGEAVDGKSGRRKKATQARTLRACDRCQHRKLACDGTLDCCQQCQKANTWCTMTDPVTGTAYYRGQFDYLERRVQKQNHEIKELLSKLRAIGQDVSEYEVPSKDAERYEAWANVKAKDEAKPWEREEWRPNDSKDNASQVSHDGIANSIKSEFAGVSVQASTPGAASQSGRPTSKRQSMYPARNFVGVSTNNVLSKTKPGTRLNILGWELDIAAFIEEKDDEFGDLPTFENPVYDRTYRSFIATAHGSQPRLQNIKIPSRQQAFNYALQQLHTIGAFIPVLHKPSLIELLTRFYDEPDFRPSVGQEVVIHMSFAIAYYQTAARNFQNKEFAGFHELSDQHYHYCLGFWPQLMIGNTLQDMQALTMIAGHTRSFPKPEVGWLVATVTFDRLIQLDYHRSANSEQAWVFDKSYLELEMRKRVFWSILVMVATANGKLGRPMPLRWEDFDVEFPLAVNDEQLTVTGRDESKTGQCHFLPAVESFRIEPIFSELYTTLYALRKFPRDPVQFVEKAERRLQDWFDTRHPELQEDSSNPLMRVLAQYLRSWVMEYRLLLYHPSLSLSDYPAFNDANLRKCMEAAKGLLGVVKILKEYKAMDTTWHSCAVYILCIQTTLYGHNQFRDELTMEKLKDIRSDMDGWLNILGDVGCLLGSGMKLRHTIGRQIKEGMSLLEQHLKQRSGLPTIKRESSELRPPSSTSNMRPSSSSDRPTSANNEFVREYQGERQISGFDRDSEFGPTMIVMTTQNLPMAHYNFNNSGRGSFDSPIGTAFSTPAIALGNPSSQVSYEDHHVHVPAVQDVNGNMFIANDASTDHGYSEEPVYGGESLSWHQYTQTIVTGTGPHDYQPATALMQLGGHTDGNEDFHGIAANGTFDGENVAVSIGQAWPLIILDPQPEQN